MTQVLDLLDFSKLVRILARERNLCGGESGVGWTVL